MRGVLLLAAHLPDVLPDAAAEDAETVLEAEQDVQLAHLQKKE